MGKLLCKEIPPLLVLLSQNLTTNQLSPATCPSMTPKAWDVTRKKTFKLERMESQELKDAQAKIENKRQRQARKDAAKKKTGQS